MPNKCEEAFEIAAKKIATFPKDYINLKIKDSIPNQVDWDDLNKTFCTEVGKVGCIIVESELDPFWNGNKTFRELLTYVQDNCDCS